MTVKKGVQAAKKKKDKGTRPSPVVQKSLRKLTKGSYNSAVFPSGILHTCDFLQSYLYTLCSILIPLKLVSQVLHWTLLRFDIYHPSTFQKS